MCGLRYGICSIIEVAQIRKAEICATNLLHAQQKQTYVTESHKSFQFVNLNPNLL